MFGYLMNKEVDAVDKLMDNPARPFTAIMVVCFTKIEIIENLLTKVDNLDYAGGMTYTFTKALGGKSVFATSEDDNWTWHWELIEKKKEQCKPLYCRCKNCRPVQQ